MELNIIELTLVAKMNNGKSYFILTKEETVNEILKLIVEKEGEISLLDKEIETIDFKKRITIYKK